MKKKDISLKKIKEKVKNKKGHRKKKRMKKKIFSLKNLKKKV